MSKIFFITGVSTGLGRATAEAALAAGHRAVGTVRHAEQVADFEALAPGRAVARVLDVTDEDAVPAVVDDIESGVGPIDVLVGNAGYGHEGTVEESPMTDLRQQFEVNVFGAVAVVKAVLPHLRRRRQGHILLITSMGGLITFPGLAFYHGSKFALEGIAASLRQEVAPFGIHVTAVEPGGFRTDWAGRSMVRGPRSIADYDELFGPLREARQARSGHQLGDPARAGQALVEIVEAAEPPAHLVLGSDALQLVAAGRQQLDGDLATWETLSRSTDFPDA